MEIKLICNDNGIIVSTVVKVDNLSTEENLKEVFFSFVKFLDKSGAVFPKELQQIMKEFEQ
jgi:hypothetical protein